MKEKSNDCRWPKTWLYDFFFQIFLDKGSWKYSIIASGFTSSDEECHIFFRGWSTRPGLRFRQWFQLGNQLMAGPIIELVKLSFKQLVIRICHRH